MISPGDGGKWLGAAGGAYGGGVPGMEAGGMGGGIRAASPGWKVWMDSRPVCMGRRVDGGGRLGQVHVAKVLGL